MVVYQFFLELDKQGCPNKSLSKIVRCADPLEDGLTRFINEINEDGRYLPIVNDIKFKKL